MAFDERLFFWINGLAGHWGPLDWAMQRATNDYLIPVAMALFFVGLWAASRRVANREHLQRMVLVAMVGAAFASAIVKIINLFFFRPRPFLGHEVNLLFYQPIDSSFPSNCAAVTVAVAFGLWLAHRRAGYMAGFLAVLMCFARVYVGIHYPLDIIGGAACGLVATTLGWWLFRGFAKVESLVPPVGRGTLTTILYSILRPVATIFSIFRILHLA